MTSHFGKISLDLYNAAVFLSVNQSDADLRKRLIKTGLSADKVDDGLMNAAKQVGETNTGRMIYNYRLGVVIIRIYSTEINTPYGMNVLAHEIFHAVYSLLDDRGLKLTSESEEAFSYLTGYLMQKCYEIIQ